MVLPKRENACIKTNFFVTTTPMNRFVLTALLSVLSLSASAQNFAYRLRFDTYFDNLESSEPWQPTRTLFAVKLSPEVGLQLGGGHSFMAGAHLTQDLGDTLLTKAQASVYYRYMGKRLGALAGSFSRKFSVSEYPLTFFDNDWSFYNENINGLMLQYRNRKGTGHVEFFVDWQGQSQKFRIDEFMLVASTRYAFFDRLLILDAAGLLSHFKNDYVLGGDCYLLERAYYNIALSTDLRKLMPEMDRFQIGFGTLSSMEHKRFLETESKWRHNIGFQADIDLRWRWIGLKNSFYFGDGQQTFYEQYGSRIYSGSPLYRSGRYNRTDLYGSWSKKFLTIRGDIVLHAVKGQVANQETLTLSLNLHQMFVKRKLVDIGY